MTRPGTTPSVGDAELVDGLRSFVAEVLRVTCTPGVSVTLVRDSMVVWEGAFGSADLAARTPMAVDTVVCAGSMSKTYVAIAALQLVERGALDLHEPIDRSLPDLALTNPLGERPITPYDLLTYRSGLATDTGDVVVEPPAALDRWLLEQLQRDRAPEYHRAQSRWTARVGERFQYSSLGMAIVGRLVEVLDPQRRCFSSYVREEIIEPLGLRSTDIPCSFAVGSVPSAIASRIATGYARFGHIVVPVPILNAGAYPAISLVTTATDEALLLEALRRGGELDGQRVLSSESTNLMTRPHVSTVGDVPGPEGFYGLGLQVKQPGAEDESFGHGGTHPYGWWSEAHSYPRLGLTLAVCSNRRNMTSWYNPESETAPGLIHDYVVTSCSRRAERTERREARSWAWKASYVIGLLMVERTVGTLGLAGLPNKAVDAMALSARDCVEATSAWGWDADAFRTGVADMSTVEPTPDGIRQFLSGPRLRVHPTELRLLWLEFGRPGHEPAPLSFWADGPASRRQTKPSRGLVSSAISPPPAMRS